MKKYYSSLSVLIFMFLSINSLAQEVKEETVSKRLSEMRSLIKIPEISNTEKDILISQSRIIFSEAYVNLKNKEELYKIDPLGEFDKLKLRAPMLNSSQYHLEMLKIYNSVRDLHVNYILPKPQSCMTLVLPLSMSRLNDGKIIVNTIDLSKKDLVSGLEKINLADEVIRIDGRNIQDVFNDKVKNVSASTNESRFKFAIFDLYWRDLGANEVPEKDDVLVTIQPKNGKSFDILLPWITKHRPKCLLTKNETEKEKINLGKRSIFPRIEKIQEMNTFWEKIKNKYSKYFFNKLSKNFLSNKNQKGSFVDLIDVRKSEDSNIEWKILNIKNQNVGYLKLSSFETPKGIPSAIDNVRKIVVDHFKKTSSIIIDLRSNYGGQIEFAEQMAALFHPNPLKQFPFYIRANQFALTLFDENTSWYQLISKSINQKETAGPEYISNKKSLLNVSQIYFGKVAVLTNAECFSSCEIFTAAIKDFGQAKIYGTDRTTFGGGANVWGSEYLKSIFESQKLPISHPQGVNIRLTVRHGYRPLANTIIDDVGIESDMIIPEEVNEIINPTQSQVVYKVFEDILDENDLKLSSDYKFESKSDFLQIHGKENNKLTFDSGEINQVALYKDNIFVKRIHQSENGKIVLNFQSEMNDDELKSSQYTVYGFDTKSGSMLPKLRKSLAVEFLSAFENLDEQNSMTAKFKSLNDPYSKTCGWKNDNESLVLQGGYCNLTQMDSILSLKLNDTSKSIEFDIDSDTEIDFDFFEAFITHNGKIFQLIKPESNPLKGHFKFSLESFAGENIDIRFRVTSDDMGAGKGVFIKNININ